MYLLGIPDWLFWWGFVALMLALLLLAGNLCLSVLPSLFIEYIYRFCQFSSSKKSFNGTAEFLSFCSGRMTAVKSISNVFSTHSPASSLVSGAPYAASTLSLRKLSNSAQIIGPHFHTKYKKYKTLFLTDASCVAKSYGI